MVSRYIRVRDDVPRTVSGKVQKHPLRKEGVAADTCDGEVTR